MEIIAHRGASGYCPENTLSAFRKALEMGVKAIELDVQLTKDNELVVIHDFSFDRTTNGQGLVMDKTYNEVKDLDAGSWFASEFRKERVPLLSEVLSIIPESIKLNVEIKKMGLDQRKFAKKVLTVVESHGLLTNTIFSSFDHELLSDLKKHKDVAIKMLFNTNIMDMKGYIERCKLHPLGINHSINYVNASMVKEMHLAGYQVGVFTINNPELALLCKSIGVDAIFTNYPDIMTRNA